MNTLYLIVLDADTAEMQDTDLMDIPSYSRTILASSPTFDKAKYLPSSDILSFKITEEKLDLWVKVVSRERFSPFPMRYKSDKKMVGFDRIRIEKRPEGTFLCGDILKAREKKWPLLVAVRIESGNTM